MPFGTDSGMRMPSMGSGMAQSAAEVLALRPYWENEYAQGMTNQPFESWVKNPEVMARYQNASKIMPGQVSGQPQDAAQMSPQDQQLMLMRMMQNR